MPLFTIRFIQLNDDERFQKTCTTVLFQSYIHESYVPKSINKMSEINHFDYFYHQIQTTDNQSHLFSLPPQYSFISFPYPHTFSASPQRPNYIPQSTMQQYKAIDIIGEGSFGTVYLIRDSKQREFALKKIHVDPYEVEQALKEIEVVKKLAHPNVVRIFNSGFNQPQQLLEIIMEYCEEGNLLSYFKKKNKYLTVEEILRIFKQIVQAFIAMNVKGVFHRDLKPENILITKDAVIKVSDIGCARSFNQTEISQIVNFSFDQGTLTYASPEMLKNEKYSFKCDVWSAGCLLYFIYYGNHPFMDSRASRAHSTLAVIKKLTQNKEIQIHQNTDPTIAKLISLTLIYEDKERASWREMWLSRCFSDKIKEVQKFTEYLKNIAIVANWMARQFWKIRKEFTIGHNKDELFVYFIIKFQYSALKTALMILKKSSAYRYLFDDEGWNNYEPKEEYFNELKKNYLEHQKYFSSIRKSMQSKEAFINISEREPVRFSAFCDLDNSIIAAYKILLDVHPQLEDGGTKKEHKIWIAMARWINFQKSFAFQREPRVEKIIEEAIVNIKAQVSEQIAKYEDGNIE